MAERHCDYCNADYLSFDGCNCTFYDLQDPISWLRVMATGEPDSGWDDQQHQQYSARIGLATHDRPVLVDLMHNDLPFANGERRPSQMTLQNLHDGPWTVTDFPGDGDGPLTVYEAADAYAAKLVHVPVDDRYVLAVRTTGTDSTEMGSRAFLTMEESHGEWMLNEYADSFIQSSKSTVGLPTGDGDWLYRTGPYITSDVKRVTASERPFDTPPEDRGDADA